MAGMAGQDQVGIYSAAMTIANLWIFIPNALIDSARPLILSLKAEGKENDCQRRWRQLYAGIIWISIFAGIFVMIFGKLVVRIIYGLGYMSAISVLMILIWSRLFSLLGLLRTTWMLCENCEQYVKYFVGLGAVMNVVLNSLLIPKFGADGAAIATLATEIGSSLLVSMWYKKTRPLTAVIWDAFRLKGLR